MAQLVNFIVAREHQGDRLTDAGSEVHRFQEGEIRTADPAIVAQLVASGVLLEPAPKAKPARGKSAGKADKVEIENKSEGASPQNKGA